MLHFNSFSRVKVHMNPPGEASLFPIFSIISQQQVTGNNSKALGIRRALASVQLQTGAESWPASRAELTEGTVKPGGEQEPPRTSRPQTSDRSAVSKIWSLCFPSTHIIHQSASCLCLYLYILFPILSCSGSRGLILYLSVNFLHCDTETGVAFCMMTMTLFHITNRSKAELPFTLPPDLWVTATERQESSLSYEAPTFTSSTFKDFLLLCQTQTESIIRTPSTGLVSSVGAAANACEPAACRCTDINGWCEETQTRW